MEPRTVKANDKVEADHNHIAVERGPVVYCAEWTDNNFNLFSILLNKKPTFEVVSMPDLLYGINQIRTQVQVLSYGDDGRLKTADQTLTLIPYYAWAHRGTGAMKVWLEDDVSALHVQK